MNDETLFLAPACDLVTKLLPNGDLVVYSPSGSAHPFVLTDLALAIYRLLEIHSSSEVLKEWATSNGVSESSLAKVLQQFERENIIVRPSAIAPINRNRIVQKRRITLGFWIHMTDICNLRCMYCFVTKGSQAMTPETIERFITTLKNDCQNGEVTAVRLKFAGGEPLVALPRVIQLAELAKSTLEPLGVRIALSIITNGTLVTPTIAQILKDKGFSVMISLDGIEKNNDLRVFANGRSSFSQVVKGIENLIDAGIKPGILTVISGTNMSGLEELTRFVVSKSLPISVTFLRELNAENQTVFTIENVERTLVPWLEWLAHLPDDEFPVISYNNIDFNRNQARACGAGRNYLAIGPTGELGFCQMTISSPMTNISASNSILQVLDNYELPELSNTCKKCTWRYVCGGGCAVLNSNSGRVGGPNVLCSIYKLILPHLLVIEGRKIQKKGGINSGPKPR